MTKYIKVFDNHDDYLDFLETDSFIKPNVSYCKDQNEVHYNPMPHDYADDYLTFVAKENGTFTFTPSSSNVISYSTDNGTTWTEGNTVSVNSGDKILWKGAMTPASSQGVGKFGSTANFDVQGNAMSLLFGDNYKEQIDLTGKNYAFCRLFNGNTKVVNAGNLSLPAETLANYCYQGMFHDCTSLVNAPSILPTEALAEGCYRDMFRGCTSLTTAPVLPATTLASSCYSAMFRDCTSLTTAPVLPATTLAVSCYGSMFQNCTSLTTAPELPAETLASNCYSSMFRGCTSLTSAPELPATTLAESCYGGMFNGCTSLTTAPELPATTLANYCYFNMFYNCTGLTNAPELPAETLAQGCYNSMFNDCTSLNYIKAMFTTTPSTTYTSNWVNGVAANGTFVKNSAATWNMSGADAIPTGWTVQTAS